MKLVSAILPTRGRQKWAAQAVECFRAQTYPNKQLIIYDDYEDMSFPDGFSDKDAAIKHYLSEGQLSIPFKRNRCCEHAAGDIIWHLDSDDWSAPTRMAEQVKLLEESGKSVAGFHSMLFYVEPSGATYKYVNDKSFSLGTSLMFTKAFWASHPFRQDPAAAPNVGEDSVFVKAALNTGELISVDAGQLMVARIHESNTSIKDTGGAQTSYWPVAREALPHGFFQQ